MEPTSYQTREIAVEFRAAQTEDGAREFTGIGVPYGEPQDIGLWVERFAPGSVTGADAALIMYQHRDVIGKVIAARETEAGMEITGRLSATALGDDVYTLMRDGVLTRMSIGFQPITYHTEEDDDGTEVIVWDEVRAREFSLVAIPAYDAAEVTNVRNHQPATEKEPIMDTLTRADLTPINEALDVMQRRLDTIATEGRPGGAGTQWRSMGEFLKAVAAGDNTALEFHRDYTGIKASDGILKDSFVGDFVKLVEKKRRLINRFSRAPLPADGMSVDYYQVDKTTIKIGEQAKEGDNLPGPSKVTLKSANAPVKTYGGWTEISRQAIERATVPTLDITLRAMGLEYAANTEAALRAVYLAEAKKQSTANNVIAAPAAAAAMTAQQWVATLIKAVEAYDDTPYTLCGIDVSADIFEKLATEVDKNGRLMLNLSGTPVNSYGTVDLGTLTGDLAGIRLQLLPNAEAGTAIAYDDEAIKTLESSGAPAQLQDENIINLTKQFSLYGYLAFIVPFPDAIKPVKFAG